MVVASTGAHAAETRILGIGFDSRSSGTVYQEPSLVRRCKPVKSMKCQKPATTPQQIVRRFLNRNSMGWSWSIWDCIIDRESKWIPTVTGEAGERGLTQIHPIHFGWVREEWRLWESGYNIKTAIDLYRLEGNSFSPWVASRGVCF